jgi:hypothetical protein
MPRSRGSNKRPAPDGQTRETEDADRGACARKTLAVLYISPTVGHRLPHSERDRGGGRALPPQPPQPSTSRWRRAPKSLGAAAKRCHDGTRKHADEDDPIQRYSAFKPPRRVA